MEKIINCDGKLSVMENNVTIFYFLFTEMELN